MRLNPGNRFPRETLEVHSPQNDFFKGLTSWCCFRTHMYGPSSSYSFPPISETCKWYFDPQADVCGDVDFLSDHMCLRPCVCVLCRVGLFPVQKCMGAVGCEGGRVLAGFGFGLSAGRHRGWAFIKMFHWFQWLREAGRQSASQPTHKKPNYAGLVALFLPL